MERVAILYLARAAEGLNSFKPFLDSYTQFPSEYPHDLILAGKGLTKKGLQVATSLMAGDIPHRIITMSDEGYDIHAYLKAAEQLDHDFVLCCNTWSRFVSPGWLRKMMAAAETEGVGLVGATGSYESLLCSNKFICKADWVMRRKRSAFDLQLAEQFRTVISKSSWKRMLKSQSYRWFRSVSDTVNILRRPIKDSYLFDAQFENHWALVVGKGGPFNFLANTRSFPNPHIRSNAFLINRELFLSLGYKLKNTKSACNLFECGPDGMTTKIERMGLKAVIVGADGNAYEIADWAKSGTFRLGNQENLLIEDNQTEAFHAMSPIEKAHHQRITWGDFLKPEPKEYVSLGLSFARGETRLSEDGPAPKYDKLISIVIPTHDRWELVRDAIETVKLQTDKNWELIVFDNASREPVADYVNAIGHSQIRAFRSEEFLPVTDSWNTAMNAAKGEYVTLIGDDDGLAPGFFERVRALADRFDEPDCIYSSIYQFMHPGVAPWERAGYVALVRNGFFFRHHTQPFLLSEANKTFAVQSSLSIRRNFTFNMQGFVFSRKLINEVSVDGKFFLSPFPDYYIANVVFAQAKNLVIDPRPLTIAGVSRASFGFTLFNNLESVGAQMLNTNLEEDDVYRKVRNKILPGSAYLSKYIITMQHVADRLGSQCPCVVDFDRYRRMQILSFIQLENRRIKWRKTPAGKELWKNISLRERLWARYVNRLGKKRRPSRRFEKIAQSFNPVAYEAIQIRHNVGDFTNTVELFNAIRDGSLFMESSTLEL